MKNNSLFLVLSTLTLLNACSNQAPPKKLADKTSSALQEETKNLDLGEETILNRDPVVKFIFERTGGGSKKVEIEQTDDNNFLASVKSFEFKDSTKTFIISQNSNPEIYRSLVNLFAGQLVISGEKTPSNLPTGTWSKASIIDAKNKTEEFRSPSVSTDDATHDFFSDLETLINEQVNAKKEVAPAPVKDITPVQEVTPVKETEKAVTFAPGCSGLKPQGLAGNWKFTNESVICGFEGTISTLAYVSTDANGIESYTEIEKSYKGGFVATEPTVRTGVVTLDSKTCIIEETFGEEKSNSLLTKVTTAATDKDQDTLTFSLCADKECKAQATKSNGESASFTVKRSTEL